MRLLPPSDPLEERESYWKIILQKMNLPIILQDAAMHRICRRKTGAEQAVGTVVDSVVAHAYDLVRS